MNASMQDVVCAALDEAGVVYHRNSAPPIVLFNFEHEGHTWQVLVLADASAGVLSCYSRCPVSAPPATRAEVMEFLHRANSGFPRGAFEMDVDEGEVRFRSGVDTRFTQVDAQVVMTVVQENVGLFAHGLPGLLEVIAGTTTAAEAIRTIEAHTNQA